MSRERAIAVIEESFAAYVEQIAFNEIVGGPTDEDGDYAINTMDAAKVIAEALDLEGLLR